MMAKETDYKAVAQQIIEVVGGPEMPPQVTSTWAAPRP